MAERIVSQTTFSRSMANDRKAGAYYTDLAHVKSCGTFFNFPEEEEVCCFDNSAGDGAALYEVTDGCRNRKLFVNDIQAPTAALLREKGVFEAVANADYLSSFECTNSVFSFFWCNPPYGEDVATHERYERRFVEKLYTHLAKGAVGVFVLPSYILAEEKFARILLARYEVIHLFKFREPTYQEFKQTVLICRRKDCNGFFKEELTAYLARVSSLEELPETFEGDTISVLPSYASKVQNFKSRIFDAERWLGKVCADSQLDAVMGKHVSVKIHRDTVRYQPPMPLGDSHLAMQATCGIGSGAVGSEEDGNYHLQRGTVRRKKEMQVRPKKDGKGMETVEVDHAQVTIKIAEQVTGDDGRPCLKITDLV